MKKGRKLIAAVVVAATLFSGTGALYARDQHNAPKDKNEMKEGIITENMIKNLQAAIKSDNEGLKSSAIYYAGYYEIDELTDTLAGELTKNNNLRTKALVSLALYKIGGNALLKGISSVL